VRRTAQLDGSPRDGEVPRLGLQPQRRHVLRRALHSHPGEPHVLPAAGGPRVGVARVGLDRAAGPDRRRRRLAAAPADGDDDDGPPRGGVDADEEEGRQGDVAARRLRDPPAAPGVPRLGELPRSAAPTRRQGRLDLQGHEALPQVEEDEVRAAPGPQRRPQQVRRSLEDRRLRRRSQGRVLRGRRRRQRRRQLGRRRQGRRRRQLRAGRGTVRVDDPRVRRRLRVLRPRHHRREHPPPLRPRPTGRHQAGRRHSPSPPHQRAPGLRGRPLRGPRRRRRARVARRQRRRTRRRVESFFQTTLQFHCPQLR